MKDEESPFNKILIVVNENNMHFSDPGKILNVVTE